MKTEFRVSRSIYFKSAHLEKIQVYASEHDMNISKAVDHFLQMGIAYEEFLATQKSNKIPETNKKW